MRPGFESRTALQCRGDDRVKIIEIRETTDGGADMKVELKKEEIEFLLSVGLRSILAKAVADNQRLSSEKPARKR